MIPLEERSVPQPPTPQLGRSSGQEPLAGYRLLEPLGRGGFGEVWKCAVSGGLVKAIKFVEGVGSAGVGDGLTAGAQELAALEQVKTIRHPFLLSIERIEIIQDTLLIVMELADRNLQTVLLEYQVKGQVGIPRQQLLGFLFEAAEALDELNFRHGLQHLDVKPHNLFVIGNHVKVGDFGLVRSLRSGRRTGGLTPLYAAPELYQQSFSRHSDQYSLAIVYQQLLSSTVPFPSPDPDQLRLQHLSANPDLRALPETDRPVLTRALAKDPQKRYPSCQDFIRALLDTGLPAMPVGMRRSPLAQRARPQPVVPINPITARALEPASSPSHQDDPLGEQPGSKTTPVRSAQKSEVRSQKSEVSDDATPLTPPLTSDLRPLTSGKDQALQKTCVQLQGCRFLECRGQNPLGELWTVEDSLGRQRLGYCLMAMPDASARALTHLQAQNHPALPAADIFWSPSGRMVLLTDPGRPTLRDALEQNQKEGLCGIPREQLLTWLHSAAQALDELYQSEGLAHLGLNPVKLLIDGPTLAWPTGRLMLADFGLVPLVWSTTGQPPAALNQRYAAPELEEPRAKSQETRAGKTLAPALVSRLSTLDSASDQYSLALIYTEMLTGIYPCLNRPASRSGHHRRPAANQAAGKGNSSPKPQPRSSRTVDLDFLPSSDREIIRRALHDDPAQRYPSCTALIEALEQMTVSAGPGPEPDQSYASLPLVLPFECLLGKPLPDQISLPLTGQLVSRLIRTVTGGDTPQQVNREPAAGSRKDGSASHSRLGPHSPVWIEGWVEEPNHDTLRFWEHLDGSWEAHCPVQVLPELLRCKLEGFRQHWRARTISEDSSSFVFQIVTHSCARGVWPFRKTEPVGLEVAVHFAENARSGQRGEVIVQIRSFGQESAGRGRSTGPSPEHEQARRDLVPRLFQSVRAFLQAGPEQRAQLRWPLNVPLRVYPILPNLEVAGVLEAQTRNISQGGLRFLTNQQLQSDHLYLHLYQSTDISSLAILARALWLQPLNTGQIEVGVSFLVDGPM